MSPARSQARGSPAQPLYSHRAGCNLSIVSPEQLYCNYDVYICREDSSIVGGVLSADVLSLI